MSVPRRGCAAQATKKRPAGRFFYFFPEKIGAGFKP